MPGRGISRRVRADLIADIYDAALDPEAWPGFAAPFAKALDRRLAFFWIGDAVGRIVDGASYGLPHSAMERYAAYYKALDPWAAAAIDRRLYHAAVGSDMVPERRFLESEFYFDFARGFDTVDALGGVIPLERGRLGVLGLPKERRARPFERQDVARLDTLLPHLQRALQLRSRLAEAHRGKAGLAALDALAIGAVVCAADGRIRFANTAAEEFARAESGVILNNGGAGVSATHPEESRRLAALIADAALGGSGGGMTISGASGGVLLVLVTPLPRRFVDTAGLVLVTLRPAAASPTVSETTLARLFRLTPAEAEVALALLAGRSLAEIGAEREVTDNTLRTQLGRILRKTDTANQRELLRLLSLLPPVR